MSDRDAPRLDHLSDAHLADKAAYGDAAAAAALLDRFGASVWRVAALASGDTATATRATARAFTRTLAGIAAGMADPTLPVGRALVAAGHELAVTARVDDAPDLVLPDEVAAASPSARVSAWLEAHEGWSAEDAAAAARVGSLSDEVPAVDDHLRAAATALDLPVPPDALGAAVDVWMDWQGVDLTIPERHPLSTVLARLDAPLGRLGATLGRAGTDVAAVARRATPRRARRPARRSTPRHRDALPDRIAVGLDLPERRHDARALVTAGATPTRARVFAALAAGILTASALGSLLAGAPAPSGTRADQVVASVATAEVRGEGDLLGDPLQVEPARASRAADDIEASGSTAGSATGSATGATSEAGGTPAGGHRANRSGPVSDHGPTSTGGSSSADRGQAGSTGGSSGNDHGGAPATGGASGSRGPSGAGGAGGPGGGAPPATNPAPPRPSAPPAPTPTEPPPPPTTAPAPTTTTPPPATTAPPPPPTTAPPGPVCTLLPALCPGGGVIPG